MCEQEKLAVKPLGWLCVVGAVLVAMLPVPRALVPEALVPEAQAVNECGASSTFVSRYSAHSTSTSYSAGDFVTTGTGANLKIWRAGSVVSGTTAAPTASTPAGWEDVTTQYAARKVVCNASDTLTSSTAIIYSDADLLIEFDRSGVTVSRIRHEGQGGEIHLKAGAVSYSASHPSQTNNAIYMRAGGADLLRFTMDSGTSVANTGGYAGSDALHIIADEGGIELNIAGNVTAAALTDSSGTGNAAIRAGSNGGSIDINITGGIQKAGGGGSGNARNGRESAAIFASLRRRHNTDKTSGTGSIEIDITGAGTVVTSPGTRAPVIISDSRAGVNSVTVGTGSTVCAGTYSSATCSSYSGRRAVDLRRQFEGEGISTLTNSGTIYGNVDFTNSATSTATNSGTINGRLWVRGTTVTVILNSGSTITNSLATSANSALYARGGTGSVGLDIVGSVTQAAATDGHGGSAAIYASSAGGSIDIDITGGTQKAAGEGEIASAVYATLYQTGNTDQNVGTGSIEIDISGAGTVLTARGAFDAPVLYSEARAGANFVTIGAGAIVCAGTYTAATSSCSSSFAVQNAVELTRQFEGVGTTMFANSGTIYGNVDFTNSATSTATNSGSIYGHLQVEGTTVTVNLNSGSTIMAGTSAGGSALSVVGGIGGVDLNIAGTVTAVSTLGNVVSASLLSGSERGVLDIDITGSSTVVHGGSSSAAVLSATGVVGADDITIGSGVVVCRGTYAASACTAGTGTAISLAKHGTQAGSGTITNSGSIWGGITVSTLTVASTITNRAGASIDGAFTGGSGSSTVSNQGTWTMRGDFDFGNPGTGNDADSFTNTGTGTFIVRHAGTTLAMNNLETFTLQTPGGGESAGILRFSLASATLPATALLNIGGATPTLAGLIDVVLRSGSMPTSGSVTLITGTSLTSGTSLSGLFLATTVSGSLAISGNNLVLTFSSPSAAASTCGSALSRVVTPPGRANMQVLCDYNNSLTSTTNIAITAARVAILYRGTQINRRGAVNTISNTGSGGEIHILSGSVSRAAAAGSGHAVSLSGAGANTLRLVLSAGTSVVNADTTSGSHAIRVSGGAGGIDLDIAGSITAAARSDSGTGNAAIHAHSPGAALI